MERKLLIDEARSYVGTKWRHLGRSRYSIDCIGLLINSMRAAGVELEDCKYGREPYNGMLELELQKQLGAPVTGDLKPGDVVAMRGLGQSGVGHVGIVAESNGYLTLIHSYNADSNSRVVEHRIDEEWMKRIVYIYRPFK